MLPNCKIKDFKTFKTMRLFPKKENSQKKTEEMESDIPKI